MFLFIVLALTQSVAALSSTLGESYGSRETMIGGFSDDVIYISKDNANVLRDGHIEVGFNGDIRKLGGSYFIWLPAPQNAGSYTLVVEDVIALVGGFPDVVDFEHVFTVEGETDYSISPGFIFSSDDFEITATLYEDFGKEISVDYPETREISLDPGNNVVDFSIGEFVGNQFVTINVGKYSVPAYLVGQDSICGDGQIDGDEICDGNNFGEINGCGDFGFDLGTLVCSSDCLGFDTSGCGEEVECDSGHLDLCLVEGNCTSAGGFWYNNSCNQYTQGSECDAEHLGLCESSVSCFFVGGFWYGNQCNEEEESACDLGDLDSCQTSNTCLNAGGYWYGGVCNSETRIRVLRGPARFEFQPAIIRSTVLISEAPFIYSFGIINTGERLIEDVFIDYNRDRFVIEPAGGFSLEPNESAQFNLILSDASGGPIRGAAVAYAGDVSEYLLFEIDFTTNEEEVSTEYSRSGSVESTGYYCSELSGSLCTADESCSGEEVDSIGGVCCVGVCEKQSSTSKAWIGYLIAAILILILLIVYVRYKKAGQKPKIATERRFGEAEKKLP